MQEPFAQAPRPQASLALSVSRVLRRYAGLLWPLSVTCLVAAIYADTLDFPFVFDDLGAIVHNPTLSAPSLLAALSPPDDTPVSGRPLVNLSFALNQRLAHSVPPAPQGFRSVNLLLHLINALLAYALLLKLLSRPVVPERVRRRAMPSALLATALWACHPLQSEAIVYVTQRSELLVSLCLLLTMHCALAWLECTPHSPARSWLLLAAISCALGVGCKETAIVAPVLVLAIERGFYSDSLALSWRAHRKLYIGMCLGLSPLLLQLLTLPRDRSAGFGLGVSAWQALAVSGHAIAWYSRLSVWPQPLSVTYNWHFDHAFARYWLEDSFVAGLCLLTFWLARSHAWIAAAGFWFFALLAPSSSVVPIISEVAAERRMYLPLLATTSAFAVAVCYLATRARPSVQTAIGGLSVLLIALCVVAAHGRAQDYASPEQLFSAALRAAPDNPQAMWGLASALDDSGQSDAALALFERMAAQRYPYVGPASWGTRGLLAASQIYARRGDQRRAQQTLQRALTHDPASTIGKLQSAARLVAVGQEPAAISLLEGALQEPFLRDRIHRELAALYARRGDLTRAARHLELAKSQSLH